MIRLLSVGLVFALLATSGIARAAEQDVSGTWSGMLPVPNSPLLFVITFKNDGAGLSATAASPYQGPGDVPVDTIALAGGNLSFTIKKLGVAFAGTVADGAITGTFSQNGTQLPLALTPRSIGTKDLAGTWIGMLKTPGGNLLLGLHVIDGPNGALTANLDSPYQQSFAIPVTSIASQQGTLTFAMSSIGASFTGKIGPSSIDGTFTQGGKDLPLSLLRP